MNEGMVFILFGIAALMVGAISRSILKYLLLPYSVVLLLLGIATGLLLRHYSADDSSLSFALSSITSIDPHLILFLFLPTLIFESAFSMETHLFKRSFTQIALLAIPGLLLAVIGTAYILYEFLPLDWPWILCLLFGALISATDPVAVVSLLKEVSSRKRLETLIEGESLINDGTAIVLFSIFSGLLLSADSFSLFQGVIDFFRVAIGGLLVGVIFGYLALLWMERVLNNPTVEISISIFSAYLIYFLAEQVLHLSGVVAVVAMALLFAGPGRTRISVQSAEFLHSFWEMMAYLANTLIFILVGLIVALKVRLDIIEWWWILGALYIAILCIRALSIAILMPILRRIGIGITNEKAIVLVWGGLRGAVSLALALSIIEHPAISPEVGEQILFFTAGIVVLTISINASTMKWLLKYLGLSGLPTSKQNTVIKARGLVYQQLKNELNDLKHEPLLLRVNWPLVGKRLFANNEAEMSQGLLGEQNLESDILEKELEMAFHRRLLETERRFYWQQYRCGGLERLAVTKLVHGVENALDGQPELGPRGSLFRYWQAPKLVKIMSGIPWVNRFSLNLAFNHMALGYEVARGYILAQSQLQKVAVELASSEGSLQNVCEVLAKNRKRVMQMIQQLQESFPEVAYSLETQTASRLLLNRERFLINKLVADAHLESSEAQKMIEDVDNQLMALRKMPRFTTSQDYLVILNQVAWLSKEQWLPNEKGQSNKKDWLKRKNKALLFLCRHATRRIHSKGDVLIKEQDNARAIPILCRGQVSYGQVSYNKAGTSLGLEAFITGHFKHELKCEGPCDFIWLDLNAIRELCSINEDLAGLISLEVQKQLEM